MAKKISQLPTTSPVQDTDYTIVYDLETGDTKKATKLDFKGDPGENAGVITSGAGAPNDGNGVENDFYINTTNGDLYKKVASVWSLIGNIIGPTGPTGPTGPGSAIRTFTWVISSPASGVVYGPRLKEAHTVTRVDSSVNKGSVTFNINERTNLTQSGSNILTTSQIALASGVNSTSFSDSSLGADNWLALNISSISSAPDQLVVTISATTP